MCVIVREFQSLLTADYKTCNHFAKICHYKLTSVTTYCEIL
jgi:hypothetical protein